MQKKSARTALISLMLLGALCLTACIPPGYTKDAARNLAKTHGKDAISWFTNNMPDAEVKSTGYYTDSQNLYMAIVGEYETEEGVFEYLYNYDEDKMYLGEIAYKAGRIISEQIAGLFSVSPDEIEIEINRNYFELTSANDEPDEGWGHLLYGARGQVNEPVFLWGTDPQKIARSCLNDDEPVCEFSADILTKTIPDYNPKVLRSIPAFNMVSFQAIMDYEYDGISMAYYTSDRATRRYTYLSQAKNRLYIGYTIEEKLTADEAGNITGYVIDKCKEQEFSYSVGWGTSFEVTAMPDGASLLFIAPLGKYYRKITDKSRLKVSGYSSTEMENLPGYADMGYGLVLPHKFRLRAYYCDKLIGSITVKRGRYFSRFMK